MEKLLEYLYKDEFILQNIAKLDTGSLQKDLQKYNIKYICFWEEGYPSLLRECEDFPLVLYYVGNPELLKYKDFISIVGTRTVTSYGKQILDNLIPVINDRVIVSGMAYGVDSYVHKLAIENNLPTIAVLPLSCHKATPIGNHLIYNSILKSNNLAISDQPPGNAGHLGLYPKRNRIIAGLSQRTVVVEAGVKSGALITADLAFNYNREVFAYPGNINSSMSAGCNYLIKNNIAQLIESADDLGFKTNIANFSAKLTEIERKIYYAILPGPKSLNEISKTLNLDINSISRICTNLQINGILNTDDQNKYHVS